MPAMLEDPLAPTIYRTSGAPPYPTPLSPSVPESITPRLVTLRDRITTATLIPFCQASDVPASLLTYLCAQFNLEIEKGDTYPMNITMSVEQFGKYWFQNFGAVMLLGEVNDVGELGAGVSWEKACLGSFYVKPNYPGRSSHVCNGGFLVTDAARNRGVGRLMGEGYLEWAPKLGYTYSVFNLVYETNVASCRIWDALGFKRVGRIKGCGNLRSHPDTLVDAIMYGRDLGPEGEDFVSEERFDKIRFYLKHGKYPNGADRAEKSRLRSAATHYKLAPPEEEGGVERLMLKDKEVVADPQRQYEIARGVHQQQHGGINKTTATIAEKYHWVRIKETVSLVIKNCPDCKESAKVPSASTGAKPLGGDNNNNSIPSTSTTPTASSSVLSQISRAAAPLQHPSDPNSMIERLVNFDDLQDHSSSTTPTAATTHLSSTLIPPHPDHHAVPTVAPMAHMHPLQSYADMPLDPQIMQGDHYAPNASDHFSGAPGLGRDAFMHDGTVGHEGDAGGAGYAIQMEHEGGRMQDDMRMATERHVRNHDEPMAFVRETEDGRVEEGRF